MTAICQRRSSKLVQVLAGVAWTGAVLALLPQVGSASEEPLRVLATFGDDYSSAWFVHQFLNGRDPECEEVPLPPVCAVPPQLSVPESWGKRIVHSDCVDDCSPFFRDAASRVAGARDDDSRQGLEHGDMVFYAGHGAVRRWDAMRGKKVHLQQFSLGDEAVRYLWMVSCRVMAHGEETLYPGSSPGDVDYLKPHLFRAGYGESVFRRWARGRGPEGSRVPLNENLRMVCGGASRVGGGPEFPMAAIWHYKRIVGLPVADSFILGLAHGFRVPMCLARGGAEPEESPLFDPEFSKEANTIARPGRLYIQYPIYSDSSAAVQALSEHVDFPKEALRELEIRAGRDSFPILELRPSPLPEALNPASDALRAFPFGFRGASLAEILAAAPDGAKVALTPTPVGSAIPRPQDICVKVHPQSGAAIASWRPPEGAAFGGFGGPTQTLAAAFGSLIDALGVSKRQSAAGESLAVDVRAAAPAVRVLTMRIDGVSESRAAQGGIGANEIAHDVKCVYVALEEAVAIGGVRVPVFGEGGEWLLSYCPLRAEPNPAAAEGEGVLEGACERAVAPVVTLAWSGPAVARALPGPVIDLKSARRLAEAKLTRLEPVRDVYVERSHRLGYKAAPPHCTQRHMYLVYRFDFRPRARRRFAEYPEITIEVPAHDLGDKSIEDGWKCSPEVPS